MRFSNVILGLAIGGISALGLVACGDETSGAGGSGSGGSTGAMSTASGNGPACAPTDAVCTAVESGCIALEDNSSKDVFSLRMAQLSMTAPAALTKGIVKNVVQNGVLMNLPKCNLGGGGTFSWILQFDKANNTLKTGGAKPVTDPSKGYSFVNETIGGAAIAPVTVGLELDASGKFKSKEGIDNLFVPIFLDAEAKSAVILPLKAATLEGTLSDNNNCIGKYNAEGLNPADNCVGDESTPTYIDDATLSGYITLEAADQISVEAIGQSLCLILSGDAAQYGTGEKPINKCKRDAGKIVFQGDWCDATNMASGNGCADAIRLGGKFAASSVKVN